MIKRIIIDTDPGVDDAFTFLLALASPEIQLEALTTTQGNVTVEKGHSQCIVYPGVGQCQPYPCGAGQPASIDPALARFGRGAWGERNRKLTIA